MHLLSQVRMGINMGLIGDIDIPTINKLFVHTQPSHLQKLRGTQPDSTRRNIERANYLQSFLCVPKNRSPEKN
jgi:protein arginine kinase